MFARITSTQLMAMPLAAATLLSLAGCPITPPSDNNNSASAKLQRFQSKEEFESYIRSQAETPLFRGALDDFAFAPTAGAPEDASNDSAGDGAANDFTSTNLQEIGVDESDVFKSDGTNFFIVRHRSVRIVRANPQSDMAELGRVEFDNAVDSIYLVGDKLLVLERSYRTDGGSPAPDAPQTLIWPPYYGQATVRVSEVDVSNPAAPTITRKIEIDGSLASSRVTNSRLVLVLAIVPEIQPGLLGIPVVTAEEIMPHARTATDDFVAIDWSQMYKPDSPNGYYMTGVVTLDATNIESIFDSTAIVANAGTIYASSEALYVTDTNYGIDGTSRETTDIHKFTFNDDGVAEYTASGQVAGRPVNQYSLGEYQGVLRIATHVSPTFFFGDDIAVGIGVTPAAGESGGSAQSGATAAAPRSQDIETNANAVFTLGERAGELAVLGQVTGIAPGETLHAARFMKDRGYLITFRRVDPLFVLDLADAANPKVLGELVIPGFSDYLHLIDDTHIIGVGKTSVTTSDGFDLVGGIQVSLFDVSDAAAPRVVQQIAIGGRGSYSETDLDPKAFTWLASRNLLALPVDVYSEEPVIWQMGSRAFAGTMVWSVDVKSGFTELGRVAEPNSAADPNDPFGYWRWSWRRSAFIGDTVYSINDLGVRAAPLSNFASTTEVELVTIPSDEQYWNFFGGAEDSSSSGR
ncbi:MAG: beta-propeller domain-containing protein [Phycisphaerales bacterium]|nr:beta-propeller domain-containing protein [Phycisphaerales bacterium]